MKNRVVIILCMLAAISLFTFLDVKPVFATDCSVVSFSYSPSSPVSWGTWVSLSGSGQCNGGVRAVRFTINGESKAETSLPSQTETWKTNEYDPGTYNVCFEVAGGSNASWENAARSCTIYEITGGPPPTITPTSTPSIRPCWVDSFDISPSSGSVGTTFTLSGNGHCDGGVRAVRFLINGTPFGEFGGPSQSTPWGTSGLSVGIYSIGFQVASGDWSNAATSYQSVTLSENQPLPTNTPVPPPAARPCWVDSFNISPSSGSVGTTFTLSGSGHCDGGVRAVRFLINGTPFGEFGGPSQSTPWGTSGLSVGTYSIGFQVASGDWGDAAISYQSVNVGVVQPTSTNLPAPTNRPSPTATNMIVPTSYSPTQTSIPSSTSLPLPSPGPGPILPNAINCSPKNQIVEYWYEVCRFSVLGICFIPDIFSHYFYKVTVQSGTPARNDKAEYGSVIASYGGVPKPNWHNYDKVAWQIGYPDTPQIHSDSEYVVRVDTSETIIDRILGNLEGKLRICIQEK